LREFLVLNSLPEWQLRRVFDVLSITVRLSLGALLSQDLTTNDGVAVGVCDGLQHALSPLICLYRYLQSNMTRRVCDGDAFPLHFNYYLGNQ